MYIENEEKLGWSRFSSKYILLLIAECRCLWYTQITPSALHSNFSDVVLTSLAPYMHPQAKEAQNRVSRIQNVGRKA